MKKDCSCAGKFRPAPVGLQKWPAPDINNITLHPEQVGAPEKV